MVLSLCGSAKAASMLIAARGGIRLALSGDGDDCEYMGNLSLLSLHTVTTAPP
jgi:hypothetical protein